MSKDGSNIRFVVQDRPAVTALEIEAWSSKCPEMFESGQVTFKSANMRSRKVSMLMSPSFETDQDFFEPQSPLEPPHITIYPSVYLLRVVLHDWPDEAARRIHLRVASNPETQLVIAEHVLPLACEDLDHTNTERKGLFVSHRLHPCRPHTVTSTEHDVGSRRTKMDGDYVETIDGHGEGECGERKVEHENSYLKEFLDILMLIVA